MTFFEQFGKNYSKTQLLSDICQHYSNQLVQQFYVSVLGLDVLGNPCNKISNVTAGTTDLFYEPFMVRYFKVFRNCWNFHIKYICFFSENLGKARRNC